MCISSISYLPCHWALVRPLLSQNLQLMIALETDSQASRAATTHRAAILVHLCLPLNKFDGMDLVKRFSYLAAEIIDSPRLRRAKKRMFCKPLQATLKFYTTAKRRRTTLSEFKTLTGVNGQDDVKDHPKSSDGTLICACAVSSR